MADALSRVVTSLPGIGPARARVLEALGVTTVRDLLLHVPRTYEDRRSFAPIAELEAGAAVTVQAEVVANRLARPRGGVSRVEARLKDATGEVRAVWFGRSFLLKTIVPGVRGVFSGRAAEYAVRGRAELVLQNPEYELLSGGGDDLIHTGRIVPVYRLTEGLTQRMLRRWIWDALGHGAGAVDDPLPAFLRRRRKFGPLSSTVRQLHFPQEFEEAERARERFAYEELLAIQLGVLRSRHARRSAERGIVHRVDGPALEAFRASLPFSLTGAQRRAIGEILGDMADYRPMARLLQGDVGCGKTIVAVHAIAAAVDGGYQTALMAPTEALAEQHARTLHNSLAPLGISVGLLTGRSDARVRRDAATGMAQVVAGTHALIQSATRFDRLGLVIVDEQHRFGVAQRKSLAGKGAFPDVLHMSATPIPRTLVLTLYGGMDVSVIDTMPPGREPVVTRRVPPHKVEAMYEYIVRQAAEGWQTYIICPLIEDASDEPQSRASRSRSSRALKPVVTHYEEIARGPLKDVPTGMLHGRLPSPEKEAVLTRFVQGHIKVLFSTTVVEVGIDVAAATTLVIEDAAQFGLTQLHQLRGRVGRGPVRSYCFLLGEPATPEGAERLEALCASNDGFEISEADLRMRGPGEVLGTRQSGLSGLRVADLAGDARLLDQARRDAVELLERDPELSAPEHRLLQVEAARYADVAL